MLDTLTPVRFDKRSSYGRTNPAFIVCEAPDGHELEVIVKLSAGCDRTTTSLAIEVVAACLAGDLGLPVPQPYLVRLDPDWLAIVPDAEWRDKASRSSDVAFGSRRVAATFSQWIDGTPILGALVEKAAAVLLFDALIDNPDRRSENPNCFVWGDEIKIFDHELAFGPAIIGWRSPWELGALNHFERPGFHIFREGLRRRELDWGAITSRWTDLPDENIEDYESVIPAEWAAALPSVRDAIGKIKAARDHIDACALEVQRVLR
ncbi:MAG TPA: HipA family kinase [Chthoniobacterales bacterium]|nr:HipA family kinase [Chthoniobacterales bacterium]